MAANKAYRVDAVIQNLISVSYDLGIIQVAHHHGTDYVTIGSLTKCLGVGPTTLYSQIIKPQSNFHQIVAKIPVMTNGAWEKDTRACMIPVSLAPALLSMLGQGRSNTYSAEVRNNISAMIKDIIPAVELELGRPLQTFLSAEYHAEQAPAVRPMVVRKVPAQAPAGIAHILAKMLLTVPGPERGILASKLVGDIKKTTGASDIFELNEEQECLALVALANSN